MFTDNEEPLIPSRFNSINTINDYQVRTDLKYTIYQVFYLLQKTKIFSYDNSTKDFVNKFINYLERVVQDTTSLMKWNKWIIKFGNLVITKLTEITYQNTVNENIYKETYTSLNESIINIIELIRSYILNENLLFTKEAVLIHDTLDRIVDSISLINTNKKHSHYKRILYDVNLSIRHVNWTIINNPRGCDNRHQNSILEHLSKLELKIRANV